MVTEKQSRNAGSPQAVKCGVRLQNDKVHQSTCRKCGHFEQGEVLNDFYINPQRGKYYTICKTCHSMAHVDRKELEAQRREIDSWYEMARMMNQYLWRPAR